MQQTIYTINKELYVTEKVKAMKLLKIAVTGLPLFKDKCEIDFLALQRVSADNTDKMSIAFNNGTKSFYQNNVLSFIGINASGKTTILKLITFVCRMLNNEPINNIESSEILDDLAENQYATFKIYFSANNKETFPFTDNQAINLLETTIAKFKEKLVITTETLKSKSITKTLNKTNLYDFNGIEISGSRHFNEYLLDDVSIMVAFNKRNSERIVISDMLKFTNTNQLSLSNDCPLELIAFFDPSIEYLKVSKSTKGAKIFLKFKEKTEIILNQLSELNRYLSSGTIKGINTFLNAINTFETGGYLIIDELENHFNQEIVSTLIRFYMDKKVNPKGATLIFSTHYSELLDEFERNDNIYIVRNKNGISVENLSNILKRNDIKKSEAYQSGFLEGTVPMYDAYIELKQNLIGNHMEEQ